MAQDTRQDLVACFTWKEVTLGFPGLATRLAEPRRRVVPMAPSWRLRQNEVEDGQIDAMGYVGPCYPFFTVFYVLCLRGIVVF
jgi:hypothetical protein